MCIRDRVSEIMGVKVEAGVKKVAFVKCAGTCDKANTDYEYTGVEDCVAMSFCLLYTSRCV